MSLWDPLGSTRGKKPIARMTGHHSLVKSVVFLLEGTGRWIVSQVM